MNNKFKPGDCVRLNSGGPLMTVVNFYNSETVNCQWFDDKDQLQSKHIIESALSLEDNRTILLEF